MSHPEFFDLDQGILNAGKIQFLRESKSAPDVAVFDQFKGMQAMKSGIKALFALSAIAVSSAAFAQAATATPSSDPFVQNREEKAAARKEYSKDKKLSKSEYQAEKKHANQKLKRTGQRSDTEKNLEVPK
jgi:hypothetical protein